MNDYDFEQHQFNLFQIKRNFKQKTTSKYEALQIFKNELHLIIHKKIKNNEDTKTFKKLKKLLFAKKTDINETKIEQARNTPIEKILDYLGMKHDRGRSITPFTESTNPTTFSFNDNFFYCFKTGKKGNAIDLTMELLNKNFKETVFLLLTI